MPQKTIKFEIVTPDKTVLKEKIIQITAPTKAGEITVLPDHIPLVATLNPGVIEIKKIDNNIEIISVSGGFIEVLRDKVVILADTAERAQEIDANRAQAAREKAEDLMSEKKRFDKERFAAVSARIATELARTRAVKRWKKIKSLDK